MIGLLLRALGAFYLFGGIMVLRALAMSDFLEIALAALAGHSPARLRLRSALLGIGGVLTATGGLALVLLHALAVPLMLANIALQIAWLLVAARFFPPEDDEDRAGRLKTMRATAFYAGAALLVVWLERSGQLVLAHEPVGFWAIAGLGAALTVWQGLRLWRGRDVPSQAAIPEADEVQPDLRFLPAQIRIEPRLRHSAVWDDETGDNLAPEWLDLPDDLRQRIIDFGLAASTAFDEDAPGGSKIDDPATREELGREAMAITFALIPLVGDDNVCWRLPETIEEWRSLVI